MKKMHRISHTACLLGRTSVVTAFLLLILLLIAPLMGGCSSSQGSSPFANNRTVSEAFSSQEREVWFEINDQIGKDALITGVYVVQDGTVSVYDVNNGYGASTMTLGDASKHDAEGVADAIIGWYKRDLGSTDEIKREGFETSYLEHGTPDFVLETDQTGNNVVSESVVVADATSGRLNVKTLTTAVTSQIYDAVWSGFSTEYYGNYDILTEISSLKEPAESLDRCSTNGIYLLQLNPTKDTVLDEIGTPDVEVL